MKKSLANILDVSRGKELLRKLAGFSETKLPSKGLLAGGAVASIILSECWGGSFPVNDIDLFQVDNFSLTKKSMPFRVTDLSIQPVDYRQCFNVMETGYRVVHSEREGMINLTRVVVAGGPFDNQHYCRTIIRGFDLNCCQAGVDLENGHLLWTEEFEKFVETGQIQVTHLATPYHTTVRLPKKRRELGCYCDIRTELLVLASYVDLVSRLGYENRCNYWYARNFGEKYMKMFHAHESDLNSFCRIKTLPEQPFLPFPGISKQDVYQMSFTLQSVADEMATYFKDPPMRLNSKSILQIYNNLYRPTTSLARKRRYATALGKGQLTRISALVSSRFLDCDHHESHLQRLERFASIHPTIAREFNVAGMNVTEQHQAIGTLKKLAKKHGIFIYGLITGALRRGAIQCSEISNEAAENLVAEYTSEFEGINLVEPINLSGFSGKTHVTELVTLDQLLEEGLCMHHCVGGYASLIKSGSSRIFHLGYQGSSSTLEISEGEIWDHRARNNALPTNDHVGLAAALNRYITHMDANNLGEVAYEISGEDLLMHQYPCECYW